jgi:hypothetical protein
MEDTKASEKITCETCAAMSKTGTWRCGECGALNLDKWKECWKCQSPRFAAVS